MQEPNKTFPKGFVIIRAKNEQVISTIVDVVLRHANDKCYSIEVGSFGSKLFYENTDIHTETREVCGIGENCFANNIEKLMSESNGTMERKGESKEIALLEANWFELEFAYSDYDPDARWISKEDIKLIHDANTRLEDCKIEVVSQEFFDWNENNLVEICGETEEFARWLLSGRQNDDCDSNNK